MKSGRRHDEWSRTRGWVSWKTVARWVRPESMDVKRWKEKETPEHEGRRLVEGR
jgi:hypothetical protein